MYTPLIVTQQDAIYFAGFLDGEGSILIYSRKSIPAPKNRTPPHQLRVTVSNTHEGVMQWIHRTFRGNLCAYKAYSRNGVAPLRARAWKWTTSCNHAAEVLEAVLPYLIVKRPQAEVALEFQRRVVAWKTTKLRANLVGMSQITPEELAARDALLQQLRDIRMADKQY